MTNALQLNPAGDSQQSLSTLPTAILGKINGFVQETSFGQVNRLFHELAQIYMLQTISRLCGSDEMANAKYARRVYALVPRELTLEEAVNRLFQKISRSLLPVGTAKMRDFFQGMGTNIQQQGPGIQESVDFVRKMWRLVECEKDLAIQEPEGEKREHRLAQIFISLRRLEAIDFATKSFVDLTVDVQDITASCTKPRYFAQIAQNAGLDLSRENAPSTLAIFHDRLLREANALGDHTIETIEREYLGSFSGGRLFEEYNNILGTRIYSLDTQLCLFWVYVRIAYPNLAGPAMLATPSDIRAWLNDGQNVGALDQVRSLTIRGLSIVPPEIGKFRRLQNLHLDGRGENLDGRGERGLSGFPEEMSGLQGLRRLDLRGNNLREIPYFVSELRALESLKLGDSIRVLPEEIWQRFYQDGPKEEFFNNSATVDLDRERTLQIGFENLRDAPFALWFRHNFSSPYLPFADWILTPLGFFGNHEMSLNHFLLACFAVPLYALQFLLNLPALLFNTLLHYGVEPLVMSIRDWRGYSRMTHLRD